MVLFTASNAEGVEVIKGGQKYKVCSFNIHWGANSNEGSEHLINGRAYPGEVHIITVKDTLNCQDITSYTERDDVLVILVFLKAVNTHIANIWQKLSPVPQGYLQTKEVSHIQLTEFLPAHDAYYHYEGSLTTPPFNEIIQWYVLKQPIEIPEAYLRQLRSTLDQNGERIVRNFREIQPLNGRKVSICTKDCIRPLARYSQYTTW